MNQITARKATPTSTKASNSNEQLKTMRLTLPGDETLMLFRRHVVGGLVAQQVDVVLGRRWALDF
jgi:hypothetical protein